MTSVVNYIRYGNKDCRTFKPSTRPVLRSDHWDRPIDTQQQSPFFARLPAEIRNTIYVYVFSHNDNIKRDENSAESDDDTAKENPQSSPSTQSPRMAETYQHYFPFLTRRKPIPQPCSQIRHPLSLTLTCRLAHSEAQTLAFTHHSFLLPKAEYNAWVPMADLASRLLPSQQAAISNLTYDMGDTFGNTMERSQASDALHHAILFFPNLEYFTFKVLLGYSAAAKDAGSSLLSNVMHYEYSARDWNRGSNPNSTLYLDGGPSFNDFERAAIRKFAPMWFRQAVALGTKRWKWNEGETWGMEWPQLKSEYLRVGERWKEVDKVWIMSEVPEMQDYMAGEVFGIVKCTCDCGEAKWVGADLVQEGGRRVRVVAELERREQEDEEEEEAKQERPNRPPMEPVVLIPGYGTGVEEVGMGSGFMYEPGVDYWNALRQRKSKNTIWGRLTGASIRTERQVTQQQRDRIDVATHSALGYPDVGGANTSSQSEDISTGNPAPNEVTPTLNFEQNNSITTPENVISEILVPNNENSGEVSAPDNVQSDDALPQHPNPNDVLVTFGDESSDSENDSSDEPRITHCAYRWHTL